MSNLTNYNQPNYKHLLVFDTIALLSADETNRIKIWRNNEKLGECYIPGATHAEISNLAQDYKNPKDQARARAFLNFQSKEGHYKIQPVEDNKKIPLDNQKDRQILTCAYRLATENPKCIVILITYDSSMQSLVKQSKLPNFCYLNAREIGDWYHNLYHQNKVPKPVSDTYERIKKSQLQNQNNQSFEKVRESNDHSVNNTRENSSSPCTIKESSQTPVKTPSNSRNKIKKRDNFKPPILKEKKKSLNPLYIGIGIGCLVIGVFLAINSFPGGNAVIVPQEQVDNRPVEATPSNLIANAEAAIIQFQETKEPSVLRNSLNELQTQKNKQGLRLDNEGEQRLSRLKHKYAIEVLASSGQKAEAAKMLEEVSKNYSEYKAVKKSLAKLRK